ncbi:MAG: porin family protein [Hyphomicrobiaceae bacterium]|nr:MAG: porin family protein [Hyphomicrobiaceae bacterium]
MSQIPRRRLGQISPKLRSTSLSGNWAGAAPTTGSRGNKPLCRGRLGFLITPSFYLYVMAGLAWADYDVKALTIDRSETFFGYQVGVGGELRMSRNWGLRLDYFYTDLQATTKDYPGFSNTYEPDFHTVRAGLTFRF